MLNEREILDYLMTSDFNEGLTHEESRFLLLKFRHFYRILHGKNENMTWEVEKHKESLVSAREDADNLRRSLSEERASLTREAERALTWKERLTGKKTKPKNGS